MREQRESSTVWALAIVSMLVILFLRCSDSGIALEPDGVFLYNRCYQTWDCFRHGVWPFLYYQDAGGVGYGSPIFYGWYTLLPFVPFLGSILTFLRAYYLACVVLNFFAFRYLCKRFSNYATLSACFYIIGVPFVFLLDTGLQANILALGFTWLFFAFCVDFFRDGKHLALCILSYFAIWQSNLNGAVMAFIGCVALFVVYFDKSRWLDYIKLLVGVVLTLAVHLLDILTHLDALQVHDIIFTLEPNGMMTDTSLLSFVPFGGFLFRLVETSFFGGDLCCGLMHLSVAGLLAFFYVKGFRSQSVRWRAVSVACLCATAVGYVIGVWTVWIKINDICHPFFQFPIRYMMLLFGAVLVVVSRVIDDRKVSVVVLFLCIVDILIVNPLCARRVPTEELVPVYYQIMNGEYAGKDFVVGTETYDAMSGAVYSFTGASYDYELCYTVLTVDCSANPGNEVLALPRLYYNGYIAVGDGGEVFEVSPGYSNYCLVDIGDYSGSLRLEYHVPFVQFVLLAVQFASVVGLIDIAVLERRKESARTA